MRFVLITLAAVGLAGLTAAAPPAVILGRSGPVVVATPKTPSTTPSTAPSTTKPLTTTSTIISSTVSTSSVCVSTIPAPSCAAPGPSAIYLPEPCFPNIGVCYPTTYYAAQDQGQMSRSAGSFDSQMMAKCKAICDSHFQCAAFVGTENITPDSNLATGTCFFYTTQQISPRQCADSPSRIIAYYKSKVCPITTTKISTKTTTSSSVTTSRSKTTNPSSTTTHSSTTTSSSSSSSTTTTTSSRTTTSTSSTTTSSSTITTTTTSSSTATSSSATISSSTTTSTTSSSSTTTSSTTTSAETTTTSRSTSSPLNTSTTTTTTTTTAATTTTATTTPTPITTIATTTTTTTTTGLLPTITDCSQIAPASTGIYIAANGDTFTVECGKYWQAFAFNTLNGDSNEGGYASSYRDCMDQCSVTPGCELVSWYGPDTLCFLLSMYASDNPTYSGIAPGGVYDGYDRATLPGAT